MFRYEADHMNGRLKAHTFQNAREALQRCLFFAFAIVDTNNEMHACMYNTIQCTNQTVFGTKHSPFSSHLWSILFKKDIKHCITNDEAVVSFENTWYDNNTSKLAIDAIELWSTFIRAFNSVN